jgi:NADP-dependent 3-hydroxy acid dehydrogenase YdfG
MPHERITAGLDGKVVAITGASSGIGRATALACARSGAAVAVAARRLDRLQELVAEIEAQGGRAIAVKTDVTDEVQAAAFINATNDQLGGLDVLVNNAGIMLLGPIQGAPLEEWKRMVDLNIMGVLYCTHPALDLMAAAGGGHIVNISSIAGKVIGRFGGVYSLTEFGIGAFSEALRQEGMEARIRVTLIEPGRVATELLDHVRPEIKAGIASRFAGVAPLDAEDVADAVLYALSRPANTIVNEVTVRPAISPM